jgi:cell filamentation protein
VANPGDPYTWPGSDVLRNIPGLRDADALKLWEYEHSQIRAREFPLPKRFDLKQLQAVHKHLFQDTYDWAGQLRTVDIAKGGTLFATPAFIQSEGEKLSATLNRANNLQGLAKPEFVAALADTYGNWNALHPFREGNGRATREFMAQLARGAGYELDQTRIDNRADQWNDAARRSMGGDLQAVEAIFSLAIRPARAVAFEHLPESEALKKHPELAGAFAGLHAIEQALNARFPNNTKTRAPYLAGARESLIKQLDAGVVPQRAQAREPPIPRRER